MMNEPSRGSGAFLLLVVFLAGVGTLGIEMVMPRLLAPFFGTSQIIWAVVIGMTLIYLAVGYQLGGIVADRVPDERMLYRFIAWAGLLCSFIPLLSQPILSLAQQSLTSVSPGGFLGALVGVLLLFALPVTLLATVSPFAVRLQLHRATSGIAAAGRTAGSISALSTLGSIVGAFLPVLLLIPTIGTQRTIYLFAAFLIIVGIIGLRDWRYVWMIGVAGVLAAYTLFSTQHIRLADCDRCMLVADTESAYNYIQVVLQEYYDEEQLPDWRLNLVLNEGQAIHSSYRLKYDNTHQPLDLLTSGPWDYFAVAPFVYPQRDVASIRRVALLGSAVGTIPKQLLAIYGDDLHIDAVEIDPRIIDIGHEYFDMEDETLAGYTVYAQDARYWLTTHPHDATAPDTGYDIIGMDAYHQPYIPFHLTTVEFFHEVRQHLAEHGVAVVNAGRPPGGNDDRLENAIASTMLAVFPQVFMLDTRLPRSASAIIVGVNSPVGDGVKNFRIHSEQLPQYSPLRVVMEWALYDARTPIREFTAQDARFVPFTDDRAPIESLIDSVILQEVNYLSQDQATHATPDMSQVNK